MPMTHHVPANQAMIQIQGLCKFFKTKDHTVHALNNINLDIAAGKIFGIIGMSGAGKSTLIRCMNLLEQPTSGRVIVDQVDLMSLSGKQLCTARQSIGMIFQGFNLLMQRNALNNVCFPLEIAGIHKKEARLRAIELLELVGLSDKQMAYPSQLSGGQQQRVAIARALASNPKVLLCDEATSALDPDTTRSILALLKKINQTLGITIVMITHQMSLIEKICDQVAIIEDGAIVECASVAEVFSNPQSAVAKKLIYPHDIHDGYSFGERCCRIVFNGESAYEPVIANLILKFNAPVNILFADTNNLDGKAFGQMMIQFSDQKDLYERAITYLTSLGLVCEEVNADVC